MFFGETALNLDAKGRMAIPTRYRAQVAEECANALVVTYNAFENDSLWIYPRDRWEEVRDQVMSLSTFEPAHRALQRRLVGAAAELEPDGNGRIQLPQTLRQVAGLEKRVVLMGLGPRFELWNEDALSRTRHEHPLLEDSQVSEQMTRLVL